jgi:hypothetical protein
MEELEDIRASVSKRFANRDKPIMPVDKDARAQRSEGSTLDSGTGLSTHARSEFCRHG